MKWVKRRKLFAFNLFFSFQSRSKTRRGNNSNKSVAEEEKKIGICV